MSKKRFANICDAIEDTPAQVGAAALHIEMRISDAA